MVFNDKEISNSEKTGPCILQCDVHLPKLIFIGNRKILTGSLPLNSMFFSTDLGLYISEELHLLLQKNGVNVSTNPNPNPNLESRDIEDDERNDSLRSEIAASMNLIKEYISTAVAKIDA